MSKYLNIICLNKRFFCSKNNISKPTSSHVQKDKKKRDSESVVKKNNETKGKRKQALDEQTADAIHKRQEEDKKKGTGEADPGLG